jgi:hypothetical protein
MQKYLIVVGIEDHDNERLSMLVCLLDGVYRYIVGGSFIG